MKRRRKRVHRLWRAFLCVFTLLAYLLGAAYCALWATFCGPSGTASDLLTVSLLETSALKFVPGLFLTQAQVEAAVARNSVADTDAISDASLVMAGETRSLADAASPSSEAEPELAIHEVYGETFKGYMAVVKDPARVKVGVCRDEFSGAAGLTVEKIAERYHAALAVNAGAFADENGHGNGGTPLGLVISDGKLMSKANSKYPVVAGFDAQNRLIVGKIDANKAKELGLRDAVAFGPALILDGEPVPLNGAGSGLNPRTAVGQRADGAVLLLVVEGRQVNSLGATMADLITVLLEYGAVNACNLDGGSSSLMYADGAYLNQGGGVYGARAIPTALIVEGE